MASAVIGSGGDTVQILTVFLEEQVFGIPIATIQDVLTALDITKVPLSGNHIEGVMNLRGRIVTTLNLYGLVSEDEEMSDALRKERKLNVVVEQEGELYSFPVDRVGDVLMLNNDSIEPPPMTLDAVWRNICAGVYQLNESIMIILDVEKIIGARASREVEALAS